MGIILFFFAKAKPSSRVPELLFIGAMCAILLAYSRWLRTTTRSLGREEEEVKINLAPQKDKRMLVMDALEKRAWVYPTLPEALRKGREIIFSRPAGEKNGVEIRSMEGAFRPVRYWRER